MPHVQGTQHWAFADCKSDIASQHAPILFSRFDPIFLDAQNSTLFCFLRSLADLKSLLVVTEQNRPKPVKTQKTPQNLKTAQNPTHHAPTESLQAYARRVSKCGKNGNSHANILLRITNASILLRISHADNTLPHN